MLSSFMARRASTVISSVTKSLTGSSSFIGAFPVNYYGSPEPSQQLLQHQQQQIRWVTKKRQHRQIKRQRKAELATRGIFPPKPYNYIPKDTPVLNAIPKEERLQESKQLDELAAKELQNKMEQIQSSSPLMRFHLYGDHLQMSERVKKLFDLHNGNQQEVVRAQKQRGMELFQRREGDTGSSAVQGKFVKRVPEIKKRSPPSFFAVWEW